jgi:FMN-dependent NADH-azoreductase
MCSLAALAKEYSRTSSISQPVSSCIGGIRVYICGHIYALYVFMQKILPLTTDQQSHERRRTMARLLYIESSPRKERSASIQVARTFITEYERTHPDDEVEILDLWATALPAFDGHVIDSKYVILHGLEHTEEQKQAWSTVEKIISQFKETDKYLLSLPMWNFSIPYKLKHYFDVIVQPGYTFSYSPEKGYEGLVTGKPVVSIYASGGTYGPSTGMESYDVQKPYVELILGFIGFRDFLTITIDSTLGPRDEKERKIAAAQEQARKIAAAF